MSGFIIFSGAGDDFSPTFGVGKGVDPPPCCSRVPAGFVVGTLFGSRVDPGAVFVFCGSGANFTPFLTGGGVGSRTCSPFVGAEPFFYPFFFLPSCLRLSLARFHSLSVSMHPVFPPDQATPTGRAPNLRDFQGPTETDPVPTAVSLETPFLESLPPFPAYGSDRHSRLLGYYSYLLVPSLHAHVARFARLTPGSAYAPERPTPTRSSHADAASTSSYPVAASNLTGHERSQI